jgi:F420-non-reducing hydrogenase small subunit
VAAGTLTLPDLWNTVRPLSQVVEVDYVIPGCPPHPDRIAEVIDLVVRVLSNGEPLPAPGTILGADPRACCEECERKRDVRKLREFVRPHQAEIDPEICLLEQGVICLGPATRAGCGALCVAAGLPCRGCYGPPAGVRDQGAKMASALSGVIDSNDPGEIARIVASIPDMVGTFYRFSLPGSALRRSQG